MSEKEANSSTGTKLFNAEKLEISGINADVEIRTHDKHHTEVEISGSVELHKNISVTETNKILKIVSTGNSPGTGGSGSQRIFFIQGDLNVTQNIFGELTHPMKQNGDINREKARIIITAPKGIEINISKTEGAINIGDTDGILNLNTVGQYSTTIGCIRGAEVTSNGKGNIFVKKVKGFLKATVNGQGNVAIGSGAIEKLTVISNSLGNFIFEGETKFADLTVNSVGKIIVMHSHDKPNIKKNSVGEVKIGNW